MTPKNLFNIILKILGIFFIKDFLATIPQLLSAFYYVARPEARDEGVWVLLTTLAMLVIYWFVFYFLIFKTELLIDQLHLDKGFDQETIPLNIHRSTILSISIIVIGGLLVADEVPTLCRQLYSYFQEKRMTYNSTNPNIGYSIVSAVKILVGIFFMASHRQLVNMIESRRKK